MNLLDIVEEEVVPEGLLTPAEFLEIWRAEKPEIMAYDSEAPTYKWHLPICMPFALTFSWSKQHTYYITCATGGVPDQEAAEMLYEILGTTPTIVCHHAKFDLHIAKRLLDPFQLPLLTRRIDDTMLLDGVLDENRHHGLKERCTDLGISFDDQSADTLKEQIGEWIKSNTQEGYPPPDYRDVPLRLMVPYARGDAYLTYELFRYLKTDMEEMVAGQENVRDVNDIYDLELQLLWVLFQMEERGMRVDLEWVWKQVAVLTPTLDNERRRLVKQLGFEINPLATDDVARALTQLGHGDALWVNPKTKKVNLPEWRLEQLENDPAAGDLVQSVLRFRSNSKMLNTYYEPLLHENALDEKGEAIVRCNNKQLGARTGRMSVTEPALQTIPREKGEVRAAFISREGHKLIFADYAQQELRVLAHYMFMVKDDSVKRIFEEGLVDLHSETAAAIFEVPYDKVTSEQRRLGKNTNFAIVYGAGIKKIASMHNCDEATAKARLWRLYSRFPGLQQLKKTCEKRMLEREYVVTAFGRRHREKEGRFAYKAVNSLVQGTSADQTKYAMVKIDRAFRERGMDAMILLMVHDEIITEAPDHEVEDAVMIIHDAMLDVPQIQVPMDVEIAVATRWSEAK